jgi:hypothetical protein
MYARNVGEALSPIEFLWSGWCPVQAARAVCCTNPHPMGQQHIALRTSDGAFALARLYASCDEAPFFPASRRSTTSFRGWAHTLMVHRRCVSMRHSITGYGMVNISAWSRYACLSIQRNLLAWRRGRPLTPLVGDADADCVTILRGQSVGLYALNVGGSFVFRLSVFVERMVSSPGSRAVRCTNSHPPWVGTSHVARHSRE